MDMTTVLPNTLNGLLAVVFFSISVRALFLYTQLRSPRLFVLGLAMSVIAITALAELASGIITSVTFHIDWFLFLGQAISFGFIFLSLLRVSDRFLGRLILWQVICALLVFSLLVLAPWLPDMPNTTSRVVLSGARALGCVLIFSYYIGAFASKGTRFSLLMSIAFVLLSVGYLLILPKYVFAGQESLDQLGDGIRIVGLVILLSAYLKG